MDTLQVNQGLLSRIGELPSELLDLLQHGDDARQIHAITSAALDRRYTDLITIHFTPLLGHVCASICDTSDHSTVAAVCGRIIPLAPYLAGYAERFLPAMGAHTVLTSTNTEALGEYLLGLYRLLRFDLYTFKQSVDLPNLRKLVTHKEAYIRYLAVRIICACLHASDMAMEKMLQAYGVRNVADGPWENKRINYRFLTLWEEQRMRENRAALEKAERERSTGQSAFRLPIDPAGHHPTLANLGGTLLPGLVNGSSSALQPLVETPTTVLNLQTFAEGLKSSSPLLLTGLAGSGKTLVVRHAAHMLNMETTMVTLHLNEQSDAKLLIGMYTTGATPGSFTWQPGVLTRAVQEGRWVFIEDIDRAPNEVMSTLLPLIERRELLIPSRGQTIRAARGFRIIATLRTVPNANGEESKPALNMVGARLWNQVHVQMPPMEELRSVIVGLHPLLEEYAPQLVTVFEQLQLLRQQSGLASRTRSGVLRAVTPRDLLKWASRVVKLLGGRATFSSGDLDQIFLDAVDCFAGALPESPALDALTACIAEHLQIDPRRRDFLLRERTVSYQAERHQLQIGRNTFQRQAQRGAARISKRAFSTNAHTLRVLERVSIAVAGREPLLLVGETGTGKTTTVQHMADELGKKLVPFNLSQQSESGDLLGGFKPVNVRSLIVPLKDEFDDLFGSTFSLRKNQQFLDMLGRCVAKGQWSRVCRLWREALGMVEKQRSKALQSGNESPARPGSMPNKKRRVEPAMNEAMNERWDTFAENVKAMENRLSTGSESNFAFAFVEGNIVKAVRNGDWVLLDEINLASADTLEALADLFDASSPSLMLSEAGSVERIHAHPEFRIFAAMNPATDVGKKDLPLGIRSRFTELYVDSPDRDLQSLQSIVQAYLGNTTVNDQAVIVDISALHQKIQELAEQNLLVDGAGQKPHFSLRTLTRALTYAKDVSPLCSIRRALFEGFQMSYLTLLDKESESRLLPLMQQALFSKHKNVTAELKRPFSRPNDGHEYIREGQYWLRQGAFPVEEQPHYIITPFIRHNLDNLIRASSTRRSPVLIQGPTSAGKTSMIEYLAKRSGNKFVRINNHEHTDLQEYLGTYVSGADGRLRFEEGILVKALREGHWIVLDELNLAPTDVLEALNRLLDDNRELLIPETQETVRPHGNFMLFATQNPAGLYGGRKVLSRAFRNRFLELHFDDIPVDELHEILHRRTQIPDSWCKRIVSVYRELSVLRQENRLFEQKSFATLRDLFRWALRKADTIQDLAVNGFLLLAERVRKPEEREAVKKVIEKVLSARGPKVTIDEAALYSEQGCPELAGYQSQAQGKGVVWTNAMRRLYVLVAHAVRNNEPVLLVGETGCGKTTVVQMLADAVRKELHIVNAHQNTETGDLIGAQRPLRNRAAIEEKLRVALLSLPYPGLQSVDNSHGVEDLLQIYDTTRKAVMDQPDASDAVSDEVHSVIQVDRTRLKALFEWSDGSLVHAMKTGQFFLLDEISLADDSVLERLNSVLEPSRSILLAEKGSLDSFVTAQEGFQFFATMNPGGDYGKRELSPALRNRFTEIWVPALSDLDDVLQIIRAKLKERAVAFAPALVHFAQWFNQRFNTSAASSISIRDTLAWIEFVNRADSLDPTFAVVHGAAMVYIDTLGANPAALLAINPAEIQTERAACLAELGRLLQTDAAAIYSAPVDVQSTDGVLALGAFSLPIVSTKAADPNFTFLAPTTRSNSMRVVRALQLSKPVLLEGNPGVGKTTLVTALANTIGMSLTRINLSEQTDLMDLFGSDVPVEGAEAGTFAWRDAPFLRAMKNGEWVLLDEMNLASQSVLEGLNACLDHRGEVYISELDQTFRRHPSFRLFAAQNPHHQGGGRKGLPASFVNRFTVVYADVFRKEDLVLICQRSFPHLDASTIGPLVEFIDRLDNEVGSQRKVGSLGGPWEVNLRDTLRWLNLVSTTEGMLPAGDVSDFLDVVISQRFRTTNDRAFVFDLFCSVLQDTPNARSLFHTLGTASFEVGLGLLPRHYFLSPHVLPDLDFDFRPHLATLESMMIGIQKQWPLILVGPPGAGKTMLIQKLASLAGASLVTFSMNADIDSMDLVGGYEQADPQRERLRFLQRLEKYALHGLIASLAEPDDEQESLFFVGLHQLCSAAADPLINQEKDLFKEIAAMLSDFTDFSTADVESIYLTQRCAELASKPPSVERAQFEWTDGLLVQALEQGQWLVLDNANLCSPAVLDRLNSLLEPNGSLIINEHTDANGQARIIKPHEDFRIFFTVDPRYGELSRALRNRAVELFLLPVEGLSTGDGNALTLSPEFALHRFRNTAALAHQSAEQQSLALIADFTSDHLTEFDFPILPSFMEQVNMGLYGVPVETLKRSIDKLNTVVSFYEKQNFQWQQGVIEESVVLTVDLGYVQTIHPLNNATLVGFNDSMRQRSLWVGALFDFEFELAAMQQALVDMQNTTKPRNLLNRLQRSAKASQIPNAAKDSTVGTFPFLTGMVNFFWAWCEAVLPGRQKTPDFVTIESLKSLSSFWWDLYSLTNSSDFDETVFQAYLDIGRSLFTKVQMPSQASLRLKDQLLSGFTALGAENKVGNARSMVALWTALKPETPRTFAQLQDLLRLEKLADKFDAYAWRFEQPLEDLVKLQAAFQNALQIVRKGSDGSAELLKELEEAMSNVALPDSEDVVAPPHFRDQFEGMCRLFDLLGLSTPSERTERPTTLAVLSRRSTKLAGHTTELQKLGNYVGIAAGDGLSVTSDISLSIAARVNKVDEVPLGRLDLLQNELSTLGQVTAKHAHDLCTDQVSAQDVVLERLFDAVSNSSALFSLDAGVEVEVQRTFFKNLRSYLQSTHDAARSPRDLSASASAWLSYALGCIQLYVPNRPFDPALRPLVERDMFRKVQEGLALKLSALQRFEVFFTGQTTSLRIRAVAADIETMGLEPSVPEVARPPRSEMMQLQGDFGALLRTVAPLIQGGVDALGSLAQDVAVRQNVGHIKRRLSEGYRAYDDITAPLIGWLDCLEIGFSLAALAHATAEGTSSSVSQVSDLTPLLGGLPQHPANDAALARLSDSAQPVQLRLHGLTSYATMRSICSDTTSPSHVAFALFDNFYEQWRLELELNQEKTAAKSSLYAYRGGQDVEDEFDEEEYKTLFPDYESTEGNVVDAPVQQRVQNLAARIADVQIHLFTSDESPEKQLLQLLEGAASTMDMASHSYAYSSDRNTIPLLITTLSKRTDEIQNSTTPQHYNVYTDANIAESKTLIDLCKRIRVRFRAIQEVWPEHATLADVIRTCDEILGMKITDPVMVYMTKVEKLYDFVHQWQTVASKEFSAAPLYDSITDLIVHWRQLELSTWARLLDMEVRKCNEDAKSWWFIAYENIIRVPMSLEHENVELRTHVTELVKTLQDFFLSTGLGQFHERLRMLEIFRQYVQAISKTSPSMQVVHEALGNFIAYMSHFKQPVAEAIAKGRQTLEKNMKDIIQLASWKDRNINALKQSAGASHRKLFKVIRKFRAILSQPADGIIRGGVPESAVTAPMDASIELLKMSVATAPEADARCAQSLQSWNERPARFKNMSATINVMCSKGQPKVEALDSSAELNTWLIDTENLATQLRKATPSLLTEENKETVKHLKTRKRKLFADVLKELRNMGFKSNLSSDALALQDSVQKVLAALPDAATASSGTLAYAQNSLHQLLHIMPNVREAAREHNDDLTSAEVARSIAFVESMLQTQMQQRTTLHGAVSSKQTLDATIAKTQNLWSEKTLEIEASSSQGYNLNTALACLPAILRASAEIASAQIKLGQLPCGNVLDELTQWARQLDEIRSKWNDLPAMPGNLTTSEHLQLQKDGRELLHDVETGLQRIINEYPYLGPVLSQTLPWASAEVVSTPRIAEQPHHSVDVEGYARNVLDFTDAILGSLQDLDKPLANLPASHEDPSWLLLESNSLASALKAMRTPYITAKLDELLDQLPQLQDSARSLPVAAAIFHSLLPILRQYASIHDYLTSRLSNLHHSVSYTSYRLAKIFVNLSKEGFCTPSEKTSGDNSGNERLEGGTGLGDGEGGEDISKDIEDDEDLTELAQEPNKEKEGEDEIEDEKDAVDMADQEMEGQMGDAEEKEEGEGSGDEDEGDEMEEEAGDVDDLGPSTVDEKMWDDGGKDSEKEKEGDDTKGTKDEDEVAADEGKGEEKEKEKKEKEGGEADDEIEEEMGADEDENVGPDEVEKMDPHVQDQENLDLPDDIDMDGDKDDGEGDSDLDDLGDDFDNGDAMEEDTNEVPEEQEADEGDVGEPAGDEAPEEEAQSKEEELAPDLDEEQAEKTQEAGEDAEEEGVPEEEDTLLQDNRKDDSNTAEDVAETEAQGTGLTQEQAQDQKDQADEGAAQQDEGAEGEATEQQQASGSKGQRGRAQENQPSQANDQEQPQDDKESLPFKKIGDALEKWYKQQQQIQDAQQREEEAQPQHQEDADMADAEFEHLPDDEAAADAQALGAAKEEQATAIDEDAGQATIETEDRSQFPPEEREEAEPQGQQDIEMEEVEPETKQEAKDVESAAKAFVGERNDELTDLDMTREQPREESPDLEEVDTQLTSTHLDPSTTSHLSQDEARALWTHHESSTRTLALVLTEHLRLILSPTQATKMRGDFRTGKRLNIKRIIPYIASSYKRDKIWMRRSVPSKRAYQIMLAIDDSESMAESGSSSLAFETLALVARSLSMLEAGELCIVGFGEDANVVHDFAAPFTSDSGAEVVRRFGFEQKRTNIRRLIEKSLELFRAARLRASSTTAELWQLQLIISDGVCEDHPSIRRLVRQAQEERIMIVFVVVDAAAATTTAGGKTMSGSILDLKTAEFGKDEVTGEMRVKTVKYLDTFPFGYYLIVRDVNELPGVLAGALRQWFAEVVETAG